MACIQNTTVSFLREMAEVQDLRGETPGIPTAGDLRDVLIALIDAHPTLAKMPVRAVNPDASTITLHGVVRGAGWGGHMDVEGSIE